MIGAAIDLWQFITGLPHMLASVPWPAVLIGLVIGLPLGAWLKWPGVLAVLTIGVGMFFMFRQRVEDQPHEHVGGKDASPPVKRVAGKRRFNPDKNVWE